MALGAPSPFGAPRQRSGNLFTQILNWLKNNDYVVLHVGGKEGHFFHRCVGATKTDAEIQKFLNNHTVVYLDLSSNSVLIGGGLAEFIESAGFKQCVCTLKGRVSSTEGIPHTMQAGVTLGQRR